MRRGFTLVEVILVIGILAFLLFLILVITTSAIGKGALQGAENILVQSLRRAQTLSQQNREDSMWGVYICPGQPVPPECGSAPPSIVLFKHSAVVTFAYNPSADQVLEINPRITFGGTLYAYMTRSSPAPATPGLHFVQLTGEPAPANFSGAITMTLDSETRTVTVGGKGVIAH